MIDVDKCVLLDKYNFYDELEQHTQMAIMDNVNDQVIFISMIPGFDESDTIDFGGGVCLSWDELYDEVCEGSMTVICLDGDLDYEDYETIQTTEWFTSLILVS